MAWPFTRLLEFIDNSTPFVSADFLNKIQDEVIRSNQHATLENWQYNSASLLDRWVVVATGSNAVSPSDGTADMPHGHVQLLPVGGLLATDHVGLRPIGFTLPSQSGAKTFLEGIVSRAPAGTAGSFIFRWGLASAPLAPDPLSIDYALFGVDWGASPYSSPTWKCVTSNGGAFSTVITTTAFPGTGAVAKLRIEVVAGVSAKFFVDGILLTTITTNVPVGATGGDTPLGPAATVIFAGATPPPAAPSAKNTTLRIGPVTYGYQE